ncbi:MAG: PDZ domain-containing protein [Alphaproteobacteria bacterium]|nr:PDZ domain-containing protein [Alphaproteobacteria bacterium]MBU2378713.1 PDZ domain-containing protein [Alphaproteobacteria bacterium]
MFVRRLLTASAFAALMTAAAPALAQEYDVGFDNAVHHEARITVNYRDLGDAPVRFQMSRSSPGRYAIHEFAKNVYSVSAVDGAGRALTLDRSDPYGWTVPGHDGTVSLTYTLFADRSDGTYAQIDATHAHLNMPATLMWAEGFDDRPVTVRFRPYDPDWKIATQLQPTDDPHVFAAPNLQYLMDSPTELSDHMVREWQVDDAGVARTIRIAMHHQGTAEEMDIFAERAKRVVDAQIAVFGDVPDFDFGTYTFIADYLPWVNGDGMEHRNSTIINNSRSLKEADFGQIGTLSHEFFHAWNVERIRPAELEPFDFTRANPTPSLWFAEGFTNYYGSLAIRRAQVSDVDRFLLEVGSQLDGVWNAPGRRYGSPQEMSLRAPFVDAATSIDPTNPNIFVSYYPYGTVIALGLDLTLRQRFPGVTLDDLMRRMWRTHGVTEQAYHPADLQTALAEVTGDADFAEDFFSRMIKGSELPDFAPLLAQAGVVIQPADPAKAWIGGVRVQFAEATATVGGAPAPGTPLYDAGLDRGDEIVSIGGAAIDSQADWTAALAAAGPGDEAEIVFKQRGVERRATLRFAADPSFRLVRAEADGGSVTPQQLAFRDAWLGPATQ